MQTAFLGEPARQLGVRQGIEQPGHRDRDRGFLDQRRDLVRHLVAFLIEADNEAGSTKIAGVVDLVHALGDVAACVCFLRVATRTSGSGLSMPMKTEKYPACCIIFNKLRHPPG